jgi:hypothetical protein
VGEGSFWLFGSSACRATGPHVSRKAGRKRNARLGERRRVVPSVRRDSSYQDDPSFIGSDLSSRFCASAMWPPVSVSPSGAPAPEYPARRGQNWPAAAAERPAAAEPSRFASDRPIVYRGEGWRSESRSERSSSSRSRIRYRATSPRRPSRCPSKSRTGRRSRPDAGVVAGGRALSDDRAPDLMAPLVGWRAWHVRLTDAGWRLFSIHYGGEAWPVKEHLVAWCHKSRYVRQTAAIDHSRHAAPRKNCLCGIYAARDLAQVSQYVVAASHSAHMAGTWYYAHRAVGQVNLWGSVVEGAQGWRAARAYPARLWLPLRRPDGEPVDAEGLALGLIDYGVPIEFLDAGNRFEIMHRLGDTGRAA